MRCTSRYPVAHHTWSLGNPGIILVILIALSAFPGAWGEVLCYHCGWMWKNPLAGHLPSTIGRDDICRPENFMPEIAHKEYCSDGCIVMILYESDPDNTMSELEIWTTTSTTEDPLIEANSTNVTIPRPPMTFFYRGCPKDSIRRTRTGCEEKTFKGNLIFHEECFCKTNLCNGSNSAPGITNGNLGSVTTFVLGCFFILSRIINPGSFSLTTNTILPGFNIQPGF